MSIAEVREIEVEPANPFAQLEPEADQLAGTAEVGEMAAADDQPATCNAAEVAESPPESTEVAPGDPVPAELVADVAAEPVAAEISSEIAAGESEIIRLQNENRLLRYQLGLAVDQTEEITAFRDAIKSAAERLANANSKLTQAKANVKEIEEQYAQSIQELRAYLEDIHSGQLRLDFTRPVDPPASPAPTAITPEQPKSAPPESAQNPAESAAVDQSGSAAAETSPPAQPDPNNGQVWGIGVLGQKEILRLVGAEEVAAHKAREEPIGLTEKQLDTLEAQGWTTIAALEKAMRENAWWMKDAGLGEKGTARVTETLRVWRLHHPQASE